VGGAQAPGLGALLGGVLASRRAVHGHGRDVDRRRRGDLWGGFRNVFRRDFGRGGGRNPGETFDAASDEAPPRRPFRCSRRPRPLRPWRWKPSRKPCRPGGSGPARPGGGRPRRARAARDAYARSLSGLREPRCPWRLRFHGCRRE
jgi:hypothetical protein